MKIWLLGIPFDVLTDQEVEKKALELIKAYEGDFKPRYLTSPSFRAIDSCFGYFGIKDDELLAYYRNANLSLLSKKPLLMLSWGLGDPLPFFFSPKTLVQKLIETMSFAGKKIFLLGDQEKVIEHGALELMARFPTATIAGVLVPSKQFKKKGVQDLLERDRLILSAINESSADLLLWKRDVRNGALWLNRVKKELKVPLSMGLGTALESYHFPNGENFFVKGARVFQEGISSLFRFAKFTVFSLPLLLFYKLNEGVSYLQHTKKCPTLCQKEPLLFLSDRKTIEVLRLPCLLDKERVQALGKKLQSYREQDEFIVDFQSLRHLDLYGFYFLYTLWKTRKKDGKGILGIRARGDIRWLLRLNKLWDVIGGDMVDAPKEALDRMKEKDSLFVSVEQDENGVHLYFLGKLGSGVDYEKLLEMILPLIEDKKVHIHKEYLTQVKSYGEWFLSRLSSQQSR